MGLYTKIIDLQKLTQAWDKVRTKKAAPGVDSVTTDMFAANSRTALKQLNIELKEKRYEPMPVRLIVLEREGKEREVGLLCLRDKIVQQAVASELHKLYDGTFARESYAFHSGRSALEAVSHIENVVKDQPDYWVLKTDIRHFFDEIDHGVMLDILKEKICEAETIELIEQFLKIQYLDENGELTEKERGICQGSTIAPVLSNIYLNTFDHQIRNKAAHYFRYADDILCIDPDQNRIMEVKEEILRQLESLKLTLKEEKTSLCQVKETFSYLGYEFSSQGRQIPEKKREDIKDRLEEMWMTSGELSFEQKAEKGLEIINGWLQYYTGERKISSIYEVAVEIYRERMQGGFSQSVDHELVAKLVILRKQFSNIHSDIGCYLAEFWRSLDRTDAVLMEYEQLWQVDSLDGNQDLTGNLAAMESLIRQYERLNIIQSKENLENMMQAYMDCHCYNKAAVFDARLKELEQSKRLFSSPGSELAEWNASSTDLDGKTVNFSMNEDELENYHSLFVGREDLYARGTVNSYGKYIYQQMNAPLTREVLKEIHKNSLATYVQRTNATVHYMIFDVDISKKVLLKYSEQTEEFTQYMEWVKKAAVLIQRCLLQMGLSSLLEFSGFRGYHVWVFFQGWISVRYVHMLQEIVLRKLREESTQNSEWKGPAIGEQGQQELVVELFPNKTRVTREKSGQCIKLPFSKHIRTGKTTAFLDSDLQFYEKQSEALREAVKYPLETLKRIIAANPGGSPAVLEKKQEEFPDITESYPDLKPSVKIVLERCQLMQYLCRKAKTTSYLTHFERMTVSYVFGHLGEDGRAFIHQVMENTLNYQYAVTDKFIHRLPEKPISCVKLRDQYKQVTAEIDCSCNFNRIPNCYPSPVLHAVKDTEEIQKDITLPLSRQMSKEREQKMHEELNVHRKVQALAEKLVALKKQQRGIEKHVRKLEDELSEIFNNTSTDCMEIEMGLLSRRKKEDRYEWVIEL